MGKPRDREALAAPCGVLDQIAFACPVVPGMTNQLAHGVELLVAGKYKEALADLAASVVFLLYLVNELPDEIKDAVAGPEVLPEVPSGVALLRGRDGGVPRPIEASLIEWQEHCLRPREARRHEY